MVQDRITTVPLRTVHGIVADSQLADGREPGLDGRLAGGLVILVNA